MAEGPPPRRPPDPYPPAGPEHAPPFAGDGLRLGNVLDNVKATDQVDGTLLERQLTVALVAEKRGAALVQAWDAHRVAVRRLSADEAAWRQVEVAGRMLVRFRREERRLVEARHLMMSVDKVLYLVALLTAVAMKYIGEPGRRAQFCEDAKLLSGGHPVEVDAELLAAVPFGRGLT